MSFAATKIQMPRLRGDLIERHSLGSRLRRVLGQARVVLLCAPAGYGKTTALVQQLSGLLAAPGGRFALAWVSCDDDDLARIATCLVQALEPLDLPWRSSPEALIAALDGAGANYDQLRDELVNALAVTEVAHGLIVLDDMHRIMDPAVFSFLDSLAERLPNHWSLVLSSRVEPPVALARWRARGELAEVRQQELRFSLDEVRDLLRHQPDHAISAERSRQMFERTGGWIAGLRLGLSSGKDMPERSRSQRHLFEYLASEVLQQMPPELRTLLLRCALLRELSAETCSVVSGDPRAAHWLDIIERRGLFVSVVQDAPPVLRLHDLFREFLEDRLRREQAGELPELMRRAASVETDPARRVSLLLNADAEDEAERALLQAVPTLLLSGEMALVLRLVGQFGFERQRQSAGLAFARGLCAWPRWDWAALQSEMDQAASTQGAPWEAQARVFESLALLATNRLEEAGQRLAQARALPLDRDTEALSELIACWQTGVRGPVDGPARHLTRMVELLSQGAGADIWYRCVPSIMFMGRAGVGVAVQAYVEGATRAAAEAHAPLLAAVHYLSAWVLLWRGQTEAAAERLRLAQDDGRWLGMPRNLRVSLLSIQMALHAMRGERTAFRRVTQDLVDDVRHDTERRGTWLGNYVIHVGWLAAGLGEWDALDEVMEMLARQSTTDEWPLMRHARLMLRAIQCQRAGDAQQVCALLEPGIDAVSAHSMGGIDTISRITLAHAQAVCARPGDGWRTLAPVIAHARASGEVLPLLCAGRLVLNALTMVPWGPEAAPEDLAQLAHWAQRATAPMEPLVASADTAVGDLERLTRLSQRESEVLERIAAGDSNKLIARALGLSPHTVKRHVANILDKIGLASRGQAAAWWQRSG